MITLFILALVISFIGGFNGEISIGVVFILSLIGLLYMLITITNRNEVLTVYGKTVFILSAIGMAYSVCELFLHIDVKSILRL